MNGFFEHQYLSYKKKHLMNLIALARTDGNFHEKEMEILYNIGKKYQLKSRHIDALLESVHEAQIIVPGTHDQYMEQLYDLVEMMLADGIIADKELEFCRKMLKSMGYEWKLLDNFVNYVQLVKDPESWREFKEEAISFKKSVCQPNF